ncbi:holin domain protein [Selenomonas sp. FOBRC9]|uniref:phage holin family protein n=1 Tax=Selenomonas sp. FOBRC9 TaxID=936573 RepID=UPI00027A415F|nr:phage holin family protein [Selenomonas sp. FOBRC9]EJP28321.1 holin domain protein [Selenomonas sp. FOBRC9]
MDFMPVIQRLTEGWGAKVGLSVALTIAYEDHAQIFAAFVALVCLDLVTKWLSLSRKCLVDMGNDQPSVWQAFWNIRNAGRKGYIKSDMMRKRFVPKILTYLAVVAAAVTLDFILLKTHAPAFASTLVIGYLSLTEFISILENMQHSGIEEAGALVDMARRKGGIVKSSGDKPDEKGEK